MRLVDALHDLVDGLNGGLTEGVDVSIGYLAEVDGASNAVLDVVDSARHWSDLSNVLSLRIMPLRF